LTYKCIFVTDGSFDHYDVRNVEGRAVNADYETELIQAAAAAPEMTNIGIYMHHSPRTNVMYTFQMFGSWGMSVS